MEKKAKAKTVQKKRLIKYQKIKTDDSNDDETSIEPVSKIQPDSIQESIESVVRYDFSMLCMIRKNN